MTNPAHYTSTKISPIEVIDAYNLPYDIGNAVKYVGRHRMKNGLEDLKKARWYLEHAIEQLTTKIQGLKFNGRDVAEDWGFLDKDGTSDDLAGVVLCLIGFGHEQAKLAMYSEALGRLNRVIHNMEQP